MIQETPKISSENHQVMFSDIQFDQFVCDMMYKARTKILLIHGPL